MKKGGVDHMGESQKRNPAKNGERLLRSGGGGTRGSVVENGSQGVSAQKCKN